MFSAAQYSEALRKIESCVLKSKSASERVEELSSEWKQKEALYKSLKKTYDLLPTAQVSISGYKYVRMMKLYHLDEQISADF